jgi:hypothetical protein
MLFFLYIPHSVLAFDLSFEATNLPTRSEKIDDSHFTIMGFTIGKSMVEDIRKKLGMADVFSRTESGSDYICYISKSDKTVLILGFSLDYLSEFMLLSDGAAFKERDQCAETTLVTKNLHTESGIKLGMAKRQLKKLLGKPVLESKKKLLYRNDWKVKLTDAEIDRITKLSSPEGADAIRKNPYWYVTAHIDANFFDSKLVELKISKGEEF